MTPTCAMVVHRRVRGRLGVLPELLLLVVAITSTETVNIAVYQGCLLNELFRIVLSEWTRRKRKKKKEEEDVMTTTTDRLVTVLLSLTCGSRRMSTSGVGAMILCTAWVVAPSLSSMQMPSSGDALHPSNHTHCLNHTLHHRRRIIIIIFFHPQPPPPSTHQPFSRPRTRQGIRCRPRCIPIPPPPPPPPPALPRLPCPRPTCMQRQRRQPRLLQCCG